MTQIIEKQMSNINLVFKLICEFLKFCVILFKLLNFIFELQY